MYDLSKTLDAWFRDDDGDGKANWRDRDLDGDGILNKDDDDIDGDGVPNKEDDYPRDKTRSIMAGGEAGPMGTPPVPPMGLTTIDSIRSSVIDVVLMFDGDAASKLIEYGVFMEKDVSVREGWDGSLSAWPALCASSPRSRPPGATTHGRPSVGSATTLGQGFAYSSLVSRFS